ncbi:hypothetical protein CCR75_009293 [Bremia lactucae]|uniref:Uncharacterized protein n=1 Tax=Bremia lactucae TaxID=4779 RepID=A0A976IE56_BRELC|nr:hypothetical protein CCR75_009293 [Bremia lactucae]
MWRFSNKIGKVNEDWVLLLCLFVAVTVVVYRVFGFADFELLYFYKPWRPDGHPPDGSHSASAASASPRSLEWTQLFQNQCFQPKPTA